MISPKLLTANQQTPGSFATIGNDLEIAKPSVWANAVKHLEFLSSLGLWRLIPGHADLFIWNNLCSLKPRWSNFLKLIRFPHWGSTAGEKIHTNELFSHMQFLFGSEHYAIIYFIGKIIPDKHKGNFPKQEYTLMSVFCSKPLIGGCWVYSQQCPHLGPALCFIKMLHMYCTQHN